MATATFICRGDASGANQGSEFPGFDQEMTTLTLDYCTTTCPVGGWAACRYCHRVWNIYY